MSIETPKISVIMPTLNVKTYIEECVDSVVNQTLGDIEIIIVDAGSNDGTLEILKDYETKDSRITLLHSDKKSYGYQMNLGISKASGDYIGIVETDDYIDSRMFERLYQLSNNGYCDIVKSNFIYVNEYKDKIFKDSNKCKMKMPENIVFNLKDDAHILVGHPSIWSAIYKRDFLLLNDIKFMEAPGGGWVDNPFFFETLCLAKTIKYTDEAYYYYRESNPNSSSNKLTDITLPIRRMLDNLDVLDKYPECKTEGVLKATYWRVNVYMDNIEKRYAFHENYAVVEPYIYEMMDRLEEPVLKDFFNAKQQKRYYSIITPVDRLENGETINVPSFTYTKIKREVRYYKRTVKSQEKKIKKLKKKNKELKKENKKLKKTKKSYDSLLNSSSWKITKPLRGLFNLFR